MAAKRRSGKRSRRISSRRLVKGKLEPAGSGTGMSCTKTGFDGLGNRTHWHGPSAERPASIGPGFRVRSSIPMFLSTPRILPETQPSKQKAIALIMEHAPTRTGVVSLQVLRSTFLGHRKTETRSCIGQAEGRVFRSSFTSSNPQSTIFSLPSTSIGSTASLFGILSFFAVRSSPAAVYFLPKTCSTARLSTE